MARYVITVVDRPDGQADVVAAWDTPLVNDPATVLTAAQELALHMLTVATERAAAVTQNRGLLELLNKVH